MYIISVHTNIVSTNDCSWHLGSHFESKDETENDIPCFHRIRKKLSSSNKGMKSKYDATWSFFAIFPVALTCQKQTGRLDKSHTMWRDLWCMNAVSVTTLNDIQPLIRFDGAEAFRKDHFNLICKKPSSGFNISRF